MKLYTKRGDDGGTDMFGGKRVQNDALRVEVYGTVDELNSTVGLAAAACTHAELSAMLRTIQEPPLRGRARTWPSSPASADDESDAGGVPRISAARVAEAEQMIDQVFAPLFFMRQLQTLPGGCGTGGPACIWPAPSAAAASAAAWPWPGRSRWATR